MHRTLPFDPSKKWHVCQNCYMIGTKKHLHKWNCDKGRYTIILKAA